MAKTTSTTSSSGGIGFVGALTLLFVGLKLGGVITWSWWVVLSPILTSVVVWVLILLGVLIWAIAKK